MRLDGCNEKAQIKWGGKWLWLKVRRKNCVKSHVLWILQYRISEGHDSCRSLVQVSFLSIVTHCDGIESNSLNYN